MAEGSYAVRGRQLRGAGRTVRPADELWLAYWPTRPDAARNALVEHYLAAATKQVKTRLALLNRRHANLRMEASDITSIAAEALLRCVPRHRWVWKGGRRVGFLTYLWYDIKDAIERRLDEEKPEQLRAAGVRGGNGREPPNEMVKNTTEMVNLTIDVQQVLAGLPDGVRAVFQMRYWDDMTYREIAGALDTCPSALYEPPERRTPELQRRFRQAGYDTE